MNLNASAPRFAARFHNPRIFSAVQPVLVLTQSVFEERQNSVDLLLGVLRRDVFDQLIVLLEFDVPRGFREIFEKSLPVEDIIVDVIVDNI